MRETWHEPRRREGLRDSSGVDGFWACPRLFSTTPLVASCVSFHVCCCVSKTPPATPYACSRLLHTNLVCVSGLTADRHDFPASATRVLYLDVLVLVLLAYLQCRYLQPESPCSFMKSLLTLMVWPAAFSMKLIPNSRSGAAGRAQRPRTKRAPTARRSRR